MSSSSTTKSASFSRIQKVMRIHRFIAIGSAIPQVFFLDAYTDALAPSPEQFQARRDIFLQPACRLVQQSWGLQIVMTAWLAHAFGGSNHNDDGDHNVSSEARWVAKAFFLQFVTGTAVYVAEVLQPTALSDNSPEGTAWGFAFLLMGLAVAYGWGLLEPTGTIETITSALPSPPPTPPLLRLVFATHAVLGGSMAIFSLLYPRGFYEIPIFLFGEDAIFDPKNDVEMIMIQSWGSFILGTSTVAWFASQEKLPLMALRLRNACMGLFAGLVVLYTSYLVSGDLHVVFFWGGWVVFVFMFLLYLVSSWLSGGAAQEESNKNKTN